MKKEYSTYVKPSLQRFGMFRELTKIGLTNHSDGASILSVNSPGSTFSGRSGDQNRALLGYKASEWEAALANADSVSTS